ncbi:MAG TPA: DUF6062 family protein [Thermodesulfobacteriota bacterium]
MVTLAFLNKSPSLVEALKTGQDCPVCFLCEEDLRYFYRWYFNEYYNDPVWIIKTIDSRGFCSKHSWDLIRMGKEHEMSLVYEYLIKSTIVKLERVSEGLKKFEPNKSRIRKVVNNKRLQEMRKQLQPTEVCPICDTVSKRSSIWIENLLTDLKEEEMKELYLNSYGLCMNHFNQALETACHETAKILIQKQAEMLEELNRDLEEYSRKRDYRFSHEPKGEEQKAWVRAIKFFVGNQL